MTENRVKSTLFVKKINFFFVVKLARGGQRLACQFLAPPRVAFSLAGAIRGTLCLDQFSFSYAIEQGMELGRTIGE